MSEIQVRDPSLTAESPQRSKKLISIICPVYNEEGTLPAFYPRLKGVLANVLSRYDFEIIFINNRSTDRTLDLLKELQAKDPSIHIFTMSRNFGYQASLQAAMTYMSGDAMAIIDADCEDPPEMLLSFLEKWEEGFDVVYGMRIDRNESWWYKKFCNLYYRVLRLCADMDIVLFMAEFALIAAHVRETLINPRNTFPFVRAEIGYAGFSKFGIPYKREPRVSGRTHYNMVGKIAFAIGGMLTSSTFLMRFAAYVFPFLAVANAALLGLWALKGSASALNACLVANLTYISYLLTIQGVYQARIYKNVVRRPIFIIDPRLTYTSKAWKKQSYVDKNS